MPIDVLDARRAGACALKIIVPALILLALAIFGAPSAHAISAATRSACTPDAFRLCSAEIPDAGKVKTCMMAHRSQLSKACTDAVGKERQIRRVEKHRRRT